MAGGGGTFRELTWRRLKGQMRRKERLNGDPLEESWVGGGGDSKSNLCMRVAGDCKFSPQHLN